MGDEMNLIAKLPFFIGRRPSIWSHGSEQPPLGERGPVQGTVADDDVVVERDVEQPSSRALLGLRHGERGDEPSNKAKEAQRGEHQAGSVIGQGAFYTIDTPRIV